MWFEARISIISFYSLSIICTTDFSNAINYTLSVTCLSDDNDLEQRYFVELFEELNCSGQEV